MSDNLVKISGHQSVYPAFSDRDKGLALSEKQMNQIIEAGSKMVSDAGEIVKDLVAIAKIRAEAGADVARIEASTRHLVASVRSEIDRLAQLEKNTKTRGQVVTDIIRQITLAMETIPDLDYASRHALIDQLRWLAEAALKK